MFENTGRKLKVIALIWFILVVIASIIVFIVYLNGVHPALPGEILLALVILIAGVVVAFLSSIILYAFGDIVENAEKTKENTYNILKKFNTINTVNNISDIGFTKTNNESEYNRYDSGIIDKENIGLDWTCSNCGTVNSKYSMGCSNCGQIKKQE